MFKLKLQLKLQLKLSRILSIQVLVLILAAHQANAANIFHSPSSSSNPNNNNNNNPDRKPNIVIILADDVGTGDVPGYYDNDETRKVHMPNLQHLVNNGVTFTDAHSTPLCAPSRYVLLSGNYQHRGLLYGGTWRANYQSGQFLDGQQSIAQVLRDGGGYHTAMSGKWHLGAEVPMKEWYNPGNNFYLFDDYILSLDHLDWTQPLQKGSPMDVGFESSLMTLSGIQDGPYMFLRDGKFEELSNSTIWRTGTYDMPFGQSIIPRLADGSPNWDSTAYNMLLVNETARFLDDHMANNRQNDPFFAYIALGSVHTPHSPPKVYMDGSVVAGEYGTPHMDLLGEMDKVVGSVVEDLESRGLLDDTIIVFTSDNGGLGYTATAGSTDYGHYSSGPLKGAKGKIDEGGHRVPLIIRWNNGAVPKGETRSHLVGLNDVFATLCDLAGIDVPDGQAIDSVSFADYIADGDNIDNLRTFLGVWAVKQGIIREESIRKDNLKLVRKRDTGKLYLYDLDVDLSETQNIVHRNMYRDTVYEMMDKLKEIGPCYDNENAFEIVGSDGNMGTSSCDWFREEPWRCDVYPEGKIECRLACTRRNNKFCSLMGPPSTLSPIGSPPTDPPTMSPVGSPPTDPPTMSPIGNPPTDLPTMSPIGSPPTDSPTMSPSSTKMVQTSAPTLIPDTPSPTLPPQPCADSTERFTTMKGGVQIKRICGWVAYKDTTNRCNLPNVSMICPSTCGTCSNVPTPTTSGPTSDPTSGPISSPINTLQPTPSPTSIPGTPSPTLPPQSCADSAERFTTIKGGVQIKRICGWVANKDTTNRCNLPNVSTICPSTCGTCDF